MTARWDTEVLADQAAFDAVADEWEDLFAACWTATPFQSHSWLAAWSRAYVPRGRLLVMLVRRGGRLVGAAALHKERRGPVPVLAPVGGAISDHTDVLLAPGCPSGVWEQLTRALLADRHWALVELPDVAPQAAIRGWARAWPTRTTQLLSSSCFVLPALPLPDLLARMSAGTARRFRHERTAIENLGLEARDISASDVEKAVARLLRLHADQWEGRGGNPEHRSDRFRDHLTEALGRMIADGQAVLSEYHIAGDALGSQLHLVGRSTLYGYILGVSPHLRSRVYTAALLVPHGVELARQRGLAQYSFLRGLKEYKQRWHPVRIDQQRIFLHRSGMTGMAGFPVTVAARMRRPSRPTTDRGREAATVAVATPGLDPAATAHET